MTGLGAALITLAAEVPIFILLTLYCDKVIPSTAGVHRHWLFCLPGANRRRKARLAREADAAVKLMGVAGGNGEGQGGRKEGVSEQDEKLLAVWDGGVWCGGVWCGGVCTHMRRVHTYCT